MLMNLKSVSSHVLFRAVKSATLRADANNATQDLGAPIKRITGLLKWIVFPVLSYALNWMLKAAFAV